MYKYNCLHYVIGPVITWYQDGDYVRTACGLTIPIKKIGFTTTDKNASTCGLCRKSNPVEIAKRIKYMEVESIMRT